MQKKLKAKLLNIIVNFDCKYCQKLNSELAKMCFYCRKKYYSFLHILI